MAVISSKRRDNKRGTENDSTRQLVEEYIINVASSDEPSTIMDSEHEDVPKVGDPHPTDPNVTVKSRRLRPTANREWYIMEVSYDNNSSSQSPGGGGGGGGDIEVLEVTLGSWWEDYILEYAINVNAPAIGAGPNDHKIRIENSAKDPIKYEARRPHPLLTISANTKDPALDKFLTGVGCVNDAVVTWLGITFEPGQLLFDSYNAVSIGNNTWREDFVFKSKFVFAPDEYGDEGRNRKAGWQPWILDAGLWQWKDEGGTEKRVPIYPINEETGKPSNKPVTEPWPLDGDGHALPRDEIRKRRVFKEWIIYPSINFNAFQFDWAAILTEKKAEQLGV